MQGRCPRRAKHALFQSSGEACLSLGVCSGLELAKPRGGYITKRARLNIVDLAGSERVKKSGVEGWRRLCLHPHATSLGSPRLAIAALCGGGADCIWLGAEHGSGKLRSDVLKQRSRDLASRAVCPNLLRRAS